MELMETSDSNIFRGRAVVIMVNSGATTKDRSCELGRSCEFRLGQQEVREICIEIMFSFFEYPIDCDSSWIHSLYEIRWSFLLRLLIQTLGRRTSWPSEASSQDSVEVDCTVLSASSPYSRLAIRLPLHHRELTETLSAHDLSNQQTFLQHSCSSDTVEYRRHWWQRCHKPREFQKRVVLATGHPL